MNDEDKKRVIEFNIQNIKQTVSRLMDLLPDEQKVIGSELQKIDAAANSLYHKYVKGDEKK